MQKLTFILLFILMLPNFAQAWPGKIVAVDSANTFIILKEGQTPVKVQLAGVSPARDMVSAKSRLDSSNIVLMKDVDVRELGESSENIILGDITLDGKSLAKELLDEGVVQSTAQTSEKTLSAPEEAPAASMQKPAADSSETTDKLLAGNANDILSELSSEQDEIEPAPEITNQQQAHISSPAPAVQMQRQMPQVRYVQVYQQPQPLGLWPARPVQTSSAVAVSQPMTQQHQELAAQTLPTASSQGTAQSSEMQSPGDISKKDYELAVKVQKKAKRRERTGFFVPKKKHETFLGASAGIQAPVKPKSNVPYSDIGTMDGVMVSHFFPSGFGIGGDISMLRSSGSSGSIGGSNSTNATSYDYKSKNFDTYTFVSSLLYRFYTDPNFTPYVAAHGGFALFSNPNTDFHLSDAAPVAGAGTGFLYKFDSGFTLGADVRYLNTFGTKTHDPDGFFSSTLNIGYTFD